MTRRWWWPLGPAAVVVPAVAIVVVVLGMTWPRLGWPYPLWTRTSAQFHQQFAFGGVIASTASCWYATVLQAKDRIWVRPGAPRSGAAAVARHLTTLLCWFVGAYLVALAPLVVSTLLHDAIGVPEPLVMASGVLAMTAAVALGYALGTVVPSLVTVPVVAVGFYALIVAGNVAGEPMAAVSPMLWLEPSLGQRESLPLVVFRLALFVAVAIGAVALAMRAVARPRMWRALAGAAGWLAVPAVLVTLSLARPPVVYVADAQVASCLEQREVRYCVHHDNAPRLDELVRVVDPLVARFGTKPSNLDEVRDLALFPRPVDVGRGVELVWFEPDGTLYTDVVGTLAGADACEWEGQYDDYHETLAELEESISGYLKTGKPAGSLRGMSVAEVQRWLAQHQTQLHDCTLTSDQLPGARDR
jgi:hypothetical protein